MGWCSAQGRSGLENEELVADGAADRLDALRLQRQRVQTLAADDLILEIAADRARRQVGVVVLSTTATLKEDAFRMKLRREVDPQTFKQVTKEIDTALDQLAREHKSLTSEPAMPELPDPSLAWEDLSAEDRRALTEMLVDKIIVAPHPHKIIDGKRHYLIRAIPYQDPQQEAERAQGGARGSGQDRPQSLSSMSVTEGFLIEHVRRLTSR